MQETLKGTELINEVIQTGPLDPAKLIGDAVGATSMSGSVAAHDLSLWSLFWGADFFVQSVMLLLLAASVWSWTIIFSKVMLLKESFRRSETFEGLFWSGGSLDTLYDRVGGKPQDPLTRVFCAAMGEWRQSLHKNVSRHAELRATLQNRIERAMMVAVDREMERLGRHMGFLASVGSTALLVGLLGTVWGIIHNFQAIAASKNTSLAVVAPGIAEALFATAIGLIAAIPAAIAYNRLSAELDRYRQKLEIFSSEFSGIISRQLEEGA
jgi:biopolymer transport protein TolQ